MTNFILYDLYGLNECDTHSVMGPLACDFSFYNLIRKELLVEYHSMVDSVEEPDLAIAFTACDYLIFELAEAVNLFLLQNRSKLDFRCFKGENIQLRALKENTYEDLLISKYKKYSFRDKVHIKRSAKKHKEVKPVQQKYLDEYNKKLVNRPEVSLFNNEKTNDFKRKIKETLDGYFIFLKNYFEKLSLKISQSFFKGALDSFTEVIITWLREIRNLDRSFAKKRFEKSEVYFNKGPLMPYSRIYSLLFQRYGVEVITSIHGFTAGAQSSFFGPMELDISSTCLAPSEMSASFLNCHIAARDKWVNSLLMNRRNIDIKILKDDKYVELYKRYSEKPAVSKIKRILIVDSVIPGRYGTSATVSCWQTIFSLQNELMKALQEVDTLQVTLKLRPDSTKYEAFQSYSSNLETRNFEQIVDEADAFIFPSICSTTFGYTLLTNKPIFIFDFSLEDYLPQARDILKKRCQIITSEFDGVNPVIFNKKELIEQVLNFEGHDSEIIREYFIDDQ